MRPPLVRLEPGVDARHLADTGHQRLEARDVGGDAGVEAGAILGPLGHRQRLGRGPDRRQRVAQLVRHVGGELLGEAQVGVEAAGQLLERARQLTDLVAAADAAERPQPPPVMIDQRLGVVAELPQRAHDRQRSDDGEHQRHGQRHHHDLEHAEPHVVQPLQDAEGRLRHQHDVRHRAAGGDGPGAVEGHRPLAARGQPRRRAVAAAEGAIDFGGLDAARADQDRLGGRRPGLARSQPSPPSTEPCAGPIGPSPAQQAHLRRARAGGVLTPVEPGHALRVRDDAAAGRDDPEPDVRRLLQAIEQPLRTQPAADDRQVGNLRQRRRQQPRLLHHGALLLLEQVLLVGVEIPEAGDRQEHQQGVEQEQADGEPRVSARDPRRPRPDAAHRSPMRKR